MYFIPFYDESTSPSSNSQIEWNEERTSTAEGNRRLFTYYTIAGKGEPEKRRRYIIFTLIFYRVPIQINSNLDEWEDLS